MKDTRGHIVDRQLKISPAITSLHHPSSPFVFLSVPALSLSLSLSVCLSVFCPPPLSCPWTHHALLWLVKRNQVRCFCEVWSPSTSYCSVKTTPATLGDSKDRITIVQLFIFYIKNTFSLQS
ncbi:hypothetical protein AALO_G00109770 [Alosa alosa]|uniref:Uncharacterized protein n=1 Tax=Alosa alosa TaxID=278164 RepID=A0AAV6GV46_9TELE|nr:hypothetical protein AALO_G00109770 [Alosa alosa]